MVGNKLFVSSHPRKVDGETEMKLTNFLCSKELLRQHDEAIGKLGFSNRSEALRSAMRAQVKEAAEKSRNFVEAVKEDTTE